MNILLLTNHLKNFAGSEIQILELYQYCKSENHTILVYANIIGMPIKEYFDSADMINDINSIDIADFDFIWSQHAIFSRLFKNINNNSIIKGRFFSVHLSPFEQLELSSIPYMSRIGVNFVANSLETKDRLIELGVDNDSISISYNCAPKGYEKAPQISNLQNIAFVSNHLPDESKQAIEILRKKYNVEHVGEKNAKLMTPELLSNFDLVVTIGKTVQYAILNGKAVYCYDYFGGCGYLNESNYETAKHYNFSGRGGFNKKTAKQIVNEIENGFMDNSKFISQVDKSDFQLSSFISKLIITPPISLKEEQILLIKKSIAIEDKLCENYQSLQEYLTKNQKLTIKIKKLRKTRIFLFCVVLILLGILFNLTILA